MTPNAREGRLRRLLLTLLAASLAWDGHPTAVASVLNAQVPGKWPGGRILWYYNPSGHPTNVSDDEVIAATLTAFAEWQRVCQIDAVYAGTTSVPVDPVPDRTYVIGWSNFGSTEFHARGVRRAVGGTSSYAPLTGGGVQLNSSQTDFRAQLDNGSFVGLMRHEIGHTLGLAHSDDPISIMFADPYNPNTYKETIQGDDIAACADLYGGKGLSAKADLRDAAPEPGFPVQLSVQATRPSSAGPTGSLAEIDPVAGDPYYFARYWQGLPARSNLEARWVTPDGSVYQRRTVTTTSGTGFLFSTFPDDDLRFPFGGRWAFQFLVGTHLTTSVPFVVSRGTVSPVLPFEAAIIGEADDGGNLSWRMATYGNGRVERAIVIANGQAAAGATYRAPSGTNLVEMWTETDRPRYKPGEPDGQPSSSFDAMRQVQFAVGASGAPESPAFRVSETGTRDAYSALVTIVIGGSSPHGIYVAAVLGGRVYFRAATGWSDRPAPLVSVQAPAVAGVDLVRNVDVRGLPRGTALYVGYGQSVDDLLARGQFVRVREF